MVTPRKFKHLRDRQSTVSHAYCQSVTHSTACRGNMCSTQLVPLCIDISQIGRKCTHSMQVHTPLPCMCRSPTLLHVGVTGNLPKQPYDEPLISHDMGGTERSHIDPMLLKLCLWLAVSLIVCLAHCQCRSLSFCRCVSLCVSLSLNGYICWSPCRRRSHVLAGRCPVVFVEHSLFPIPHHYPHSVHQHRPHDQVETWLSAH